MTFLLEQPILAGSVVIVVIVISSVLLAYFSKHLDNWVLWYLFFLPIAPQIGIGNIPFSFIDILFGVGLVGFFINLFRNKKIAIPLHRVIFMTLFLLSYLFITCLFSFSMWGGEIGLLVTLKFIRQIEIYLPFFILGSFIESLDTQFVKKMVYVSIIGGIISAGLALIPFFTPVSFFRWYAGPYEKYYDYPYALIGGLKRATGVFLEPNHLAAFLSIIILLGIILLLKRVNFIDRKLLLISLIPLISCMLLTFSRGGWLNLLLGISVYCLLSSSKFKTASKLMLVGLFAGIIIYCFYPALGSGVFLRASKTFQAQNLNQALSGRIENWKYFLVEIFPASPIIGIGYKVNSVLAEGKPPDNVPLMMLVEGGIIGLIIFCGWYLVISLHLISLPKSSWMTIFLIASWVGISFQMLTADILTYWRALPYFFSFLALSFNRKLIEELNLYKKGIACPG